MPRVHTSKSERFWSRVDGGDYTECWLWQGSRGANGYGHFGPALNEHYLAHRFAYEDMRAPIPPGLQIDHLCRVRACVNPWHLEPVTARENLRRGPNEHRPYCPEGHEYAGDNLYVHNGKRYCRACRRETQRRYLLRKQAA